MVMNLSYWNQILWLVYITIKNLNAKILQFQKQQKTLLLSSIPIIYEHSKDANYKYGNLKTLIYHKASKTIFQHIYLFSLLLLVKKWDVDNIITLFEYIKKSIKLAYANDYKKRYYPIFADFMIDYKERVFIINIKAYI